jgi:hypothetical protein
MPYLARNAVVALLLVVLPACSSAPREQGSPEVAVRRSERNLITADEIAASGAVTAWQAVERLRPHMLQIRGTSGLGSRDQLAVYLDGQRAGDESTLTSIQAHEVSQIRFLSGSEATNRYGTGHSLGAIVVTRKKP